MVTLLSMFACGEQTKSVEHQNLQSELDTYSALETTEASTKKFMEDYIRAVNSQDWKTNTLKFLRPNPEDFLKEHTAFRNSFPNYEATIKHLMVEGNQGIVWINITANYVEPYLFKSKDDVYGDNILKDVEAKNQELTWDETWQFNVVDGKFGEKWDFLKDNYAVIKGLKVN